MLARWQRNTTRPAARSGLRRRIPHSVIAIRSELKAAGEMILAGVPGGNGVGGTWCPLLLAASFICNVTRMLEDVVEVLDRSWRALDHEEGFDFALNCFRFHEQLARDPRTGGILEDLRREEAESKDRLDNAHAQIAVALSAVSDQLEREASEHFDPEPKDDYGYDTSLKSIRARLERAAREQPSAYGVGKERTDEDLLSDVVAILDGVATRADKPEIRGRIEEVQRSLEHAHRERRIFFRTSAGSALVVLERELSDMHPPETDQGLQAELAQMSRARRTTLGQVADAIFGNGDERISDEESEVRAFLDDMRADMRRIYEDVRRRIGAERSLLAVFQRYRTRCQWYEVDALRAIAARGRGKAEDRLVETLATYLFDHGLNPLTQPLAGRIRPDLLDAKSAFSFYVEAKQYRTAARSYLLKGMQQVWDMLDQLRGSGFCTLGQARSCV